MFVTILSIIYFALALFIVIRFLREKASKISRGKNKILLKVQKNPPAKNSWKKSETEKEQVPV